MQVSFCTVHIFESHLNHAAHALKSSQPLPLSQPTPSVIATSPYELFLLEEGRGQVCGDAIIRNDDNLSCLGANKVAEADFTSQLQGACPFFT
jgi:hypothetical protein